MSQCVPDWDFDDSGNNYPNPTPTPVRRSLRSHSFNPNTPDAPMSNYEVAELTWENGQIAMHALGPPRPPAKPLPLSKYAWVDKPRAANASAGAGTGTGTLECIVNQAVALPRGKLPLDAAAGDLVPWFDPSRGAAALSATMTMDALVPCAGAADDRATAHFVDSAPGGGIGTCVAGCSTRVGSCNGAAQEEDALAVRKRARVERGAAEWSGMDQSASGSATFGRDSQQMTLDTGEMEIGVGMTSTSLGSPENTCSGKDRTTATAAAAADDHDSVCYTRPPREGGDDEYDKKRNRKSSASTKRSRAAAIHNQSERKRRDKINQRMKTLQKLVPNSSKTDKASVLDEVIEYLKQLQAQVQMVNRMNMQPLMMPMAMQQQLQMSMMGPMGLGMMGMGMPGMGIMDMNALARPNLASIPPVLHPAAAAAAAFMPMGSWDSDRVSAAAPKVVPDPLSAFLASQSQPMPLDAYNRIAAMYQQMHQPPASSSKN
ncbi:BHLH domain-containing protein [Psidium guajava]|nr:BHLH domain-containing protein [Psidium guajava]